MSETNKSAMESGLPGGLAVILRQKHLIAFAFVTIAGVVAAAAFFSPRIYQSEARLLDRMGRETLQVDPTVSGPTMDISQTRESEINSELAILRSRLLAEKVVNKIGVERLLGSAAKAPGLLERLEPGPPLPATEKAVEKFIKSLRVEVESKSNVISLTYEARDPETAHDALEELIQIYLQRHLDVYRNQAPPAFFKDQLERLGAELRSKEEGLSRFRLEHGIIDLNRQKDALLTQIAGLEATIAEADGQAKASEAKIAALSKSLSSHKERIELNCTTGKTNYAADSMKGRMVELRQKEADLATRYGGTDRQLAVVREQIHILETTLAREKETQTEVMTGVDLTYQSLDLALATERGQLDGATARRNALSQSLDALQKKLTNLSAQQTDLDAMQREVTLMQGEYIKSSENLSRARVATALDNGKISNISIVQPATLSLRPIKPRVLLMLGLGLFLGLLFGLALAFFVDSFRSSGIVHQPAGFIDPEAPLPEHAMVQRPIGSASTMDQECKSGSKHELCA